MLSSIGIATSTTTRGGEGGKSRRANTKDYDENNGVEDNNNKAPLASVYSAMDAFAKNRETPQRGDDDDDNDNGAGNPKKFRRKRLVEKTTMENKGYLHTETVSVWKDIND